MKKASKKYLPPDTEPWVANEPVIAWDTKHQQREVLLKDFDYKEFKKIADKAPFSLAEWAEMLHTSERTLQRYAKDNAHFNGLQIERILLLEKFIDLGNDLFGQEGFKNWVSGRPYSLGGASVIELLTTHDGIQSAIDLIGKLQYGIPA